MVLWFFHVYCLLRFIDCSIVSISQAQFPSLISLDSFESPPAWGAQADADHQGAALQRRRRGLRSCTPRPEGRGAFPRDELSATGYVAVERYSSRIWFTGDLAFAFRIKYNSNFAKLPLIFRNPWKA